MWDTFDLLVFNVIWGSFGALVSMCHVIRKQLAVERNATNLGLWVVAISIWETFHLLVFVQGQLESFGLACLKIACNSFLASDYVREWHFKILTW